MSREEARAGVSAATTASTVAGRDWILKALDPINTKSQILGMPTAHSHDVVVTNYTSNYNIGPPNYYGSDATKDSFDADIRLFQNPIVFGVCHAGRQGTKRVDGNTPITVITETQSGATPAKLVLPIGYEPWTSTLLTNTQVNNPTSSYTSSLTGRYEQFANGCQAHRMIYGGVQCLPTCSAMFNQGSFRVTQQIFQPTSSSACAYNDREPYPLFSTEETHDSGVALFDMDRGGPGKPTLPVQYFTQEDFPSVDNCLVNPRSMTCRFSEGLMVPYRLQNPLENEFQQSDARCLHAYPNGNFNIYDVCNRTGTSGTYDAPSRTWTLPDISSGEHAFYLKCLGDDGFPFVIMMYTTWSTTSTPKEYTFTAAGVGTGMARFSDFVSYQTPSVVDTRSGKTSPFPVQALTTPSSYAVRFNTVANDNSVSSGIGTSYTDPSLFSYWKHFMTTAIGFSGQGTTSNIRFFGQQFPMIAYGPTTLPFRENGNENLTSIFLRSVSYTATMQMIIRCGFEQIITSASSFSPFKQLCPAYDRQALQGYMRASRAMKDGFSGYYSTDEGAPQYLAFLASLLSRVAQEDNALIQFGNMGGTVDQTRRKAKR